MLMSTITIWRSTVELRFINGALNNRKMFPPNAAPQPLPEAGATQERTLEAVGCRRLFGSAGEPIVEPLADPLIV